MAKISVIIPCYNVEKYLPKCLDELIKQTYQDFEVICIDDVSTDSTPDILKKYASNDSRIIVLRQDSNQGVSAARNLGIKHATGEYILFCDSDDYYEKNALERFVTVIEKSSADAVCSKLNVIYHAHEEMKPSDLNYYSLRQLGLHKPSTKILQKLDLSTNDKMFRRSIIEQNDISFPVGLHFEDAYFAIACLSLCKNIYFLNECLYNYVRHDNSTMSDTWSNKLSDDYAIEHLYIAFKLYDFFSEHGILEKYSELFWQLLYQFSWFALSNSKTKARRSQVRAELKSFINSHRSEFQNANHDIKIKLNTLMHRRSFFTARLKMSLLKLMPLRRLQMENVSRLRDTKLEVESLLETLQSDE